MGAPGTEDHFLGLSDPVLCSSCLLSSGAFSHHQPGSKGKQSHGVGAYILCVSVFWDTRGVSVKMSFKTLNTCFSLLEGKRASNLMKPMTSFQPASLSRREKRTTHIIFSLVCLWHQQTPEHSAYKDLGMSVQVTSLLIPFTSPIQICRENAEDGELFPTAPPGC